MRAVKAKKFRRQLRREVNSLMVEYVTWQKVTEETDVEDLSSE